MRKEISYHVITHTHTHTPLGAQKGSLLLTYKVDIWLGSSTRSPQALVLSNHLSHWSQLAVREHHPLRVQQDVGQMEGWMTTQSSLGSPKAWNSLCWRQVLSLRSKQGLLPWPMPPPTKNSDQDRRLCPNKIKSKKKKREIQTRWPSPPPASAKRPDNCWEPLKSKLFPNLKIRTEPSSWFSRPAFFNTMTPPTDQEGPGVSAFS